MSYASEARTAAGQRTAPVKPLFTQQDFQELVRPVEKWILKSPGAALASAFLVGVVVAWWIKRR